MATKVKNRCFQDPQGYGGAVTYGLAHSIDYVNNAAVHYDPTYLRKFKQTSYQDRKEKCIDEPIPPLDTSYFSLAIRNEDDSDGFNPGDNDYQVGGKVEDELEAAIGRLPQGAPQDELERRLHNIQDTVGAMDYKMGSHHAAWINCWDDKTDSLALSAGNTTGSKRRPTASRVHPVLGPSPSVNTASGPVNLTRCQGLEQHYRPLDLTQSRDFKVRGTSWRSKL